MDRHDLGRPSGTDKSEEPTGIPTKLSPEDMAENQKMTERYTDDDGAIANDVRTGHPNRNEDKGDATNAGGYKN